MAQAIHAHNARGRAVQSTKCEKSPAKAEQPLNGSLSIACLTPHLADLQALHASMDVAGVGAQMQIQRNDAGSDAHRAAFNADELFEDVMDRALAKVTPLEETILWSEPTTADETLTLAAIFLECLDSFVTDHASTDTPDAKAEWETLERAMRAIIRGLILSGASSPVLRYYITAPHLLPWDATRSSAMREAVTYRTTEGNGKEVQS
jgi:hypothetical protein